MATWYVNTATGNDTTGNGSSVTPYATLQKAWGEASTGDSIYLCGTDTAGVDWGSTTKQLAFYGTDADWTVGGAQGVIDGENSVASLLVAGANSVAINCQFHYMTFKRATGVCMMPTYNYCLDGCLFNRCVIESNGDDIFDDSMFRARYLKFFRCLIRNNSGHFLPRPVNPTIVCCRISNNTGYALAYRDSGLGQFVAFGNVVDGNGDVWRSATSNDGSDPALLAHNVFDDNDGTIYLQGGEGGSGKGGLLLGNRLTHMGTAITMGNATRKALLACNYFHGNTLDITAGRYSEIEANAFAQATDGYEDQANGDFNLADDALMRSIELPLDWDA